MPELCDRCRRLGFRECPTGFDYQCPLNTEPSKEMKEAAKAGLTREMFDS